jgi:putative tricarboxylic transport membrane protein
MRRADTLAGVVLIAAMLVVILVVIPVQIRAAGEAQGLGAALMPTVMAGVVIALSVLLLLLRLLIREGRDAKAKPVATDVEAGRPWRVAAAMLLVLAGALLMEHVGAWAGFAAVIVGAMLLLGEHRPIRLAGVPAVAIGMIYLLVQRGIGITLP